MRPSTDPYAKRRRVGEAARATSRPSSSFFPPILSHTTPSSNPSLSLPHSSASLPPASQVPDLFLPAPFTPIPNINPASAAEPFTPNQTLTPPFPHAPFIPPLSSTAQIINKHSAVSHPAAHPAAHPTSSSSLLRNSLLSSPRNRVPSSSNSAKVPRPRHSPNGMNRFHPPSVPAPGTIGSIAPVVEALSLLPDESPIIAALAQVLSPHAPETRQTSGAARQAILAFRGFQPNTSPNFHALTVLSKVDLEILAWIFTVSKNGRKDDVARRILSSLAAPVRYRTPPPTRRPPALRILGSVMNRTPGSAAVPLHPPIVPRASTSATNSSRGSRSNMPNLSGTRGSGPSSGEVLMQHLQQQLHARQYTSSSVGTSSSSAFGHTVGTAGGARQMRSTASQHRNRLMKNAVLELLQGYDFSAPENPFNKPLNIPLGVAKNFVVFNAMQLSRGTNDPVLMFTTPPPLHPNVKPEILGGDVQIHLRCLKVEVGKQKTEWKQAWPFPASCRVNSHSVVLNQAQRYTNGKLAGLDTATNITPYLRRFKATSSDTNRVALRRQSSNATPASGQYVMFAQEVLVVNRDTMAKTVHMGSEKYWIDYRQTREKNGTLLPSTSKFEMARQGVMQFLTDPDGLTVSSMKVSLRCPLALTRIITPVKGRRCRHVQCFDLMNFLDYSRRSSKFDCPVCNTNTAYPEMLVVSPYIEHALEKYKDCDEVEIFQDGTMVPMERKQSGVASDDEDETETGAPTKNARSNGKAAEIVDLTLDSDDDETAPAEQPGTPPLISRSEIASLMHAALPNATTVSTAGTKDTRNMGRAQDMHDALMRPSGEEHAPDGVADVDEELDFSFRADFAPVSWGDPSVEDDIGHVRLQPSNTPDNWPVDVIAIDSD